MRNDKFKVDRQTCYLAFRLLQYHHLHHSTFVPSIGFSTRGLLWKKKLFGLGIICCISAFPWPYSRATHIRITT